MNDYLASPLRYPGGKSKVAKLILPYIPEHDEYRELFVGGGGIFFAKPKAKVNWINDSHPGLYAFYKTLRDNPSEFLDSLSNQVGSYIDHSPLFEFWSKERWLMELVDESYLVDRAIQYYIINRLVWGGRVCYDPRLKSRLFFSNPTGLDNIEKKLAHLKRCSEKLQGVLITNEDAGDPKSPICPVPMGDRATFIYVDPPYLRDCDASPTSRLYEKGLSREEHLMGIAEASQSSCQILFSYEDTPEVRELFSDNPWHIIPMSWTYCGRHSRTQAELAAGTKEIKPKGKELLIMNYPPPCEDCA